MQKVFIMKEHAFVEVSKDYLLCIGTKQQVMSATYDEIEEMIVMAKLQKEFGHIYKYKEKA